MAGAKPVLVCTCKDASGYPEIASVPEPGPHCRTPGLEGAGAAPTAQLRAQHCLHTHLARARTQITLIHFKPTLSPEALQQILLKPYLHNVGRHIAGPGDTWRELRN